MKRSYQLFASFIFLSSTLSAVAGCPCARQKKQMRAQRSTVQPLAPVTSVGQSVGNVVSDIGHGNVGQAIQETVQTAPKAVESVVQSAAKPAPMPPAPVEVKPSPAPAPVAKAPTLDNNRIDLAKQSDFVGHITKYPHVVAAFTTTWCGPCKALKPVLDEIRAENKNIMFVYVDGDEYPGLVREYSSVGFPTLKFFKNGKEVAQAIGGQSKDELVSLINQHFKGGVPTFVMGDAQEVAAMPAQAPKRQFEEPMEMPAAKKMKTEEATAPRASNHIVLARESDFDGHVSKNKNVIGVFSTTWCGPCKALKPVLEELVGSNSNVTFVYVDGDKFPGLVKKYSSVGFPTLKFFKNGKEVAQTIGGRSRDELQGMINQHFKG